MRLKLMILFLILFFQGCEKTRPVDNSSELLAWEASKFHNELVEIASYAKFDFNYLACESKFAAIDSGLQKQQNTLYDQWQFTTPLMIDTDEKDELQTVVLTIKLIPSIKNKNKNRLGKWGRFDIIILELNEYQPKKLIEHQDLRSKEIPIVKDEGKIGSSKLLLQLLKAKFNKS